MTSLPNFREILYRKINCWKNDEDLTLKFQIVFKLFFYVFNVFCIIVSILTFYNVQDITLIGAPAEKFMPHLKEIILSEKVCQFVPNW